MKKLPKQLLLPHLCMQITTNLPLLSIRLYKLYVLILLGATLLAYTLLPMPIVQTQPEQAHRADSFVDSLGINTHLVYLDTAYEDYNGILKPRLQELGIRHIRDGGFYSTEYFNKLKELSSIGITSLLTFFGTPPEEVVGIAKTLKESIEAVEGPNEPDLAQFNFSYKGEKFPEGTRVYQKELYAAVKGNPETAYLPVLMPSMGWGQNATRLGYLEYGDIGNLHSYPNLGERPTYDIDWYFIPHGRMISGETKPMWATETGYHNLTSDALGISETAASKYLPRLWLEYFNRDIKRVYLYELIDQQPDRNNSDNEQHYGLLRNDGSPKPAYQSIKNLITLLKEPRVNFSPGSLDYALNGNMAGVHHTLVQKSNDEFYLILWQDAKSWDNKKKIDIAVTNQNVTLTLKTIISQAEVYEPIKGITPIKQSTSLSGRIEKLTLSVPDHPLVIRLVPSSKR